MVYVIVVLCFIVMFFCIGAANCAYRESLDEQAAAIQANLEERERKRQERAERKAKRGPMGRKKSLRRKPKWKMPKARKRRINDVGH